MSYNAMFKLLWRRFKTDPLVHSCRQMILQHVFKHGMNFSVNNKNIELDDEKMTLVEDYWKPFAGAVFDAILCHGFVTVEIMEDEFKHKYPRVKNPETYRLAVNYVDNEVVLSAHDLVDNEIISNVFILKGYGFDVLRDGVFTSQMAKCLPRLGFLRELRKTAIDLEYARVTPQHFSEVPHEAMGDKEGVDFDWFVEGASSAMDENMKFQRNKTQVDQLRQQEEFYETRNDVTRKTQVALKNVVQLPMGHRLRAVASQPGRHDLVTIIKIIQEEVTTCLGVPRALMISDSIYRSSTEGINDAFKHTLLWWKSTIANVLTEVWMHVHLDELKKTVNKNDLKANKNDNIYRLQRINRVEISFPVAPYATNDTLSWLYESGVIEWDTFVSYALRNNNFPVTGKKMPMKDPDVIKEVSDKMQGKRKRDETS